MTGFITPARKGSLPIGSAFIPPVTDFNAVARRAVGAVDQVRDNLVRKDALDAERAATEYDQEVSTSLDNLDPGSDTYDQDVQELLNTAGEARAGQEFRTTAGRRAFERALDGKRKAAERIAEAKRGDFLDEQAVTRATDIQNEALNTIRQDPANVQLHMAALQQRMTLLGDALPPEARRKLAESFADEAVAQSALGLADQGRFQAAEKVLTEQGASLDPRVQQAVRNQFRSIRSKREADFNRAMAERRYDLQVLAATGQLSLADLQAAEDAGIYSGQQGQSMLASARIQVIREQQRQAAAAASQAEVAERYSGGAVDSQKEADQVYTQLLQDAQEAGEQLDGVKALEIGVQVSDRAGFVPTRVQDAIERAERANDPQSLAAAAVMHHQLTENVPHRKTGAGDRVTLAASFLDSGYSPEEAARLVIDRMPDGPTLDRRRSETQQTFRDHDFRDGLADALDLGNVLTDRDEEIPVTLVDRFAENTRRMYLLTGDPDLASAAAAKKIKQEGWARSQVGGRGHITRYPPDKILDGYQIPGMESAEFLDQEIAGFFEANPQLMPGSIEPGGDPMTVQSGIPPYVLHGDNRTQAQIAAGETPSYELLVRGPEGDLSPISRQGGQGSVRITIPTKSQILQDPNYLRAMQAQAEEAARDLERQREAIDEHQKNLRSQRNRGIRGAALDAQRRSEAEGPSPVSRALDGVAAFFGEDEDGATDTGAETNE